MNTILIPEISIPTIIVWIRIVSVYIFFWIDFSRVSFENVLGLLVASIIAYPVIVNVSEQLFNNKKNQHHYCRINFANTIEERIIEYLKNVTEPKFLKEIVEDIDASTKKIRTTLYTLANIGILCRLGYKGTNLKHTQYIGKGNELCPLKDVCNQCSY